MDIVRGGGLLQRISKTVTYTGAANLGAAATNALVFTVTGSILVVAISSECTTNLGESGATATIALGTDTGGAIFIAATNAVDIDANEFWVSTTPTANAIALPAACKDTVVNDNIVTIHAVTNTNAGVLRFDLYWMPLSADAAVS